MASKASAALRQRIANLYLAYSEGRLDAVLENFTDDVEFVSYAPVAAFPYLGRKNGKAELAATMLKGHAEFEHLSYQPVFFVIDEDAVAVIIAARLRQRASGRIIQLLIANFLRFRAEQICELREFMDTFDAIEQMLGRKINLAKT